MYPIPETSPISEFRAHQPEVMVKVQQGPVVLAQHGRPAPVLIDPAQWNKKWWCSSDTQAAGADFLNPILA